MTVHAYERAMGVAFQTGKPHISTAAPNRGWIVAFPGVPTVTVCSGQDIAFHTAEVWTRMVRNGG